MDLDTRLKLMSLDLWVKSDTAAIGFSIGGQHTSNAALARFKLLREARV